ncbi:uncharacterized protein LOC117617780 isoform X2 [Prunus dulcis]|uniref:uncharacterized protein LOC117617780 isoform X2 n=1 Tax=Prunus dulcis TaxID=3755 RepID=UPI00148326DF|nr:uncharacterized protein LOC117617780 isoform X2 [Prunus dulcis]
MSYSIFHAQPSTLKSKSGRHTFSWPLGSFSKFARFLYVAFPEEGHRAEKQKRSLLLPESVDARMKSLPKHIGTLTAFDILGYMIFKILCHLPPKLQYFHILNCDRLSPLVGDYWGLQGLGGNILWTFLKEQLLNTTLRTLYIMACQSIIPARRGT